MASEASEKRKKYGKNILVKMVSYKKAKAFVKKSGKSLTHFTSEAIDEKLERDKND